MAIYIYIYISRKEHSKIYSTYDCFMTYNYNIKQNMSAGVWKPGDFYVIGGFLLSGLVMMVCQW